MIQTCNHHFRRPKPLLFSHWDLCTLFAKFNWVLVVNRRTWIRIELAQKLRSWYSIVKAERESETRSYHYSEMVSKETSQGEWNLVFEDHKVVLAITCLGSLFLGILLAINAFSHLKVRQ